MRKFIIIFAVIYVFTCVLPLFSLIKTDGKKEKQNAPVTPFACIYLT